MEGPALPGFYGKLPGLGDFVTRRLGRGFVDPWDRWLQEAMAATRAQFEAQWLDLYLTSPVWRFALSAGLCGPQPWAGVLIPSVDRVGRYFPLTIAAAVPESGEPLSIAGGGGAWFQAAEAVILSALEDADNFTLDAFDAQVQGLGVPVEPDPLGAPTAPGGPADAAVGWRVPLASVDAVADAHPALLSRLVAERFGRHSVWWTAGSDLIAPSLALCAGLPPPDAYGALLAGGWSEWHWAELPGASPGRAPSAPSAAAAAPAAPLAGTDLLADDALLPESVPLEPVPGEALADDTWAEEPWPDAQAPDAAWEGTPFEDAAPLGDAWRDTPAPDDPFAIDPLPPEPDQDEDRDR